MFATFNISEWNQDVKYILGGIDLGITMLCGMVISLQKVK